MKTAPRLTRMGALLLLAALAPGLVAEAKDLSQRLGLGFDVTANSQSPVSGEQGVGAGFSGRYWIDQTWGIQGIVGFGVSSIDAFQLGDTTVSSKLETFALSFDGRVLGKLVDETNMHIYAGGEFGVSYANLKAGGTSTDQVVGSFGGLAGAEFFLQGLPNLSLSTEIGLAVNVGSDPNFVSVGTSGDLFGGIAIHYYFGAIDAHPVAATPSDGATLSPPTSGPPPARFHPAPAPLPSYPPPPQGSDIH